MKNIVRITKLKALTLQAKFILKDLDKLREEIQFEFACIPYGYGFSDAYIKHVAGSSIKDFNSLLKKQNNILSKLSKINSQRRSLRIKQSVKQLSIFI